jgi:hypothetical protein
VTATHAAGRRDTEEDSLAARRRVLAAGVRAVLAFNREAAEREFINRQPPLL